ncbi:MAG: Lrp/AsnC family transcriptional regulator [Nitrospiraceae bacterium]|jgi:DNA-binding Lrp family transcriptional regulator
MVNAIVLLNVERDKVNEVAGALADMKGISEAYSVSGRYDLVAIIRVKNNDDLADTVTNHMRKLNGILNTETLLAFQAYSRHDLDGMFSIGID